MTWHRPARVVVGVVALASAAAAYVSSTRRAAVAPPAVERMDPKAVLESRGAVLQQVQENEERFELKAERTLTYDDGSTKQFGIWLSVCNRSGRDYVVTARSARRQRRQGPDSWAMARGGSDGFVLEADSATYNQDPAHRARPGRRDLHERAVEWVGHGHVLYTTPKC